MKVYIVCSKCNFKIFPEMKHSFENGVCPACGEKINMGDIASANLFVQTILELSLPLNAKQISVFLDTFLRKKLGMEFPEIIFEDEPKDLIRAATNNLKNTSQNLKIQETDQNINKFKHTEKEDNTIITDSENQEENSIDVPEYEIKQVQVDLNGPPLVTLPDPKKFGSIKDGIIFVDPNQMSRTPILHKNLKDTKNLEGEN